MSIEAELLILPEIKDSDLSRAINKIDSAFKKSAMNMQKAYQKAAFEGTMKGVQMANQRMSGTGVVGGGSSSTSTSTTNIYNQTGSSSSGINPLLAAGALYMLRPRANKPANSLEDAMVAAAERLSKADKQASKTNVMSLGTSTKLAAPMLYDLLTAPEKIGSKFIKGVRGELRKSPGEDDWYTNEYMTRRSQMMGELGRGLTSEEYRDLDLGVARDFFKTSEGKSFARRNMLAGSLKKLPGAAGVAVGAVVAGYELNDMANEYIQQRTGQRIGTWTPYIEMAGNRKEPDWMARAKSLGVPLETVTTTAALYGISMDQALDLVAGIQAGQAQARYYGDKNHAFAKVKNRDVNAVIENFTKASPDEQELLAQQYPFLRMLVGKTVTPEARADALAEGYAEADEIRVIADRVLKVRDMQSKLDEQRLESMMTIVNDGTLKAYYDLEVKKMQDAVANAGQAKEDAEKYMIASDRLEKSGMLMEKAAITFSDAVGFFVDGKKMNQEDARADADRIANDLASGKGGYQAKYTQQSSPSYSYVTPNPNGGKK